MPEEKIELNIGKAPNACCPDCNIHNGYCYTMHETLLEEALKQAVDNRDEEIVNELKVFVTNFELKKLERNISTRRKKE